MCTQTFPCDQYCLLIGTKKHIFCIFICPTVMKMQTCLHSVFSFARSVCAGQRERIVRHTILPEIIVPTDVMIWTWRTNEKSNNFFTSFFLQMTQNIENFYFIYIFARSTQPETGGETTQRGEPFVARSSRDSSSGRWSKRLKVFFVFSFFFGKRCWELNFLGTYMPHHSKKQRPRDANVVSTPTMPASHTERFQHTHTHTHNSNSVACNLLLAVLPSSKPFSWNWAAHKPCHSGFLLVAPKWVNTQHSYLL